MDFTPWNWATYFRLHEAACLIAGVMPVSKRYPASEELPPQARPILGKLMTAYIEWFLQAKNPERPKSVVLEGMLNDDGTLPPFPAPLTKTPGETVSREAMHRFISLMAERGFKSCYDFGPIGKAGAPLAPSHEFQAAPEPHATAPAPPEAAWIAQAKSRAREIVARQAARDLFPNQKDIADEIAREFRAAGTVGTDGKPLSGATIKRHALKGISSATGRKQSLSIGRGK